MIRRLPPSIAAAIALLLACCLPAAAGTFPVKICGADARNSSDGLTWSAPAPLVATAVCPASGLGLSFYANRNETVGHYATAAFKISAPSGVTVSSIRVFKASSQGIGKNGWWGEFYWNGGPGPAGSTGPISDGPFRAGGCCSQTNLQSATVGWFIACNQPTCTTGTGGIERGMDELDLVAQENQAPTTSATGTDNLWYHTGWVRGTWLASFAATDPSGVCGAAVVFGSLPTILTPTPDTSPNRHTWKQCPDQFVPAAVDTSASHGSGGLGEGAMVLELTATNTAGITAAPTKTVFVDNTTPTISLSGLTDAPSTAGTQYVSTTAAGSPSGIADTICTVDGGPAESYPGASARVPVAGVGQHAVRCQAENNSVDPAGAHGRSPSRDWSLKIGQPTNIAIDFGKLEAPRCHQARRRVRARSRWITVRRHGKRVRVKTRGQIKTITILRCRPRAGRRRASRVVSFGRRSTVSGWLGTSAGTALSGRTVHVLTAPDDARNQFTQAAAVITAPNGTWSAALPPGPSRVVEATYNGDPSTEGTASGRIVLVVPARVTLLDISPRRVPWGGTIRIAGQLAGGYLPPGGALVRLRIGQGAGYSTYGVQTHVTGRGRFSTSYTFGAGDPNVHVNYWFQIGSLPQGNYPYAPSLSRRSYVMVGG